MNCIISVLGMKKQWELILMAEQKTEEATHPFKNLCSREYQGHKKKVFDFQPFFILISLMPFHQSLIFVLSNFPQIFQPMYCKQVHSVAWNCTGTKLASGSVDQTARVWHIEPHSHVSFNSIYSTIILFDICGFLLELIGTVLCGLLISFEM